MVVDIEAGSIRRQEPRIVVSVFPVQQDAVTFGNIFPEAGLYKDILVPLPVHMPEYAIYNESWQAAFRLVIVYFCAPFPAIQQAVKTAFYTNSIYIAVRAVSAGVIYKVSVIVAFLVREFVPAGSIDPFGAERSGYFAADLLLP